MKNETSKSILEKNLQKGKNPKELAKGAKHKNPRVSFLVKGRNTNTTSNRVANRRCNRPVVVVEVSGVIVV